VFVGTRADRVYAIDTQGRVYTIARGLSMPNGVAFRDGALFIADVSTILKLPNIEASLRRPPRPEIVTRSYPKEQHHGRKFIAFGPDGWLYVPQGAPCNVCNEPDPYASITRLSPDGKRLEIAVRGVRNTVGFDWHPVTRELWFTDNGRDLLGDDLPPDELNRVTAAKQHFGFPYCHGAAIVDSEFGAGKDCRDYTPPEQALGAHVASLGMRFYTGSLFPSAYHQQVFIAEHGSWNRTAPVGYRVSLVTLGPNGHPVRMTPFVEGWLQGDGQAWGRPVDVLVAPDGALLVSDDRADVIYRIGYTRPSSR
jgi:glucose/arabinose dehydrogenase